MTAKEIYDLVYQTFITEKTQFSVNENGNCYYNPQINGVGCPVGLIFNRLGFKFESWTEGHSVTWISGESKEFKNLVKDMPLVFLVAMQSWHDSCTHRDDFSAPYYANEEDRKTLEEIWGNYREQYDTTTN